MPVMGASGWSYFVPYQKDVGRALQALKTGVFSEGRYCCPPVPAVEELESARVNLPSLSPDPTQAGQEPDLLLSLLKTKQSKPRRIPRTIKALLKQCGAKGTHSILDIECISSEPAFAAITPLSRDQLLVIFGTARPLHAEVERWSTRVELPGAPHLYERWQGIYLIIYRNGRADEIYFEGCSGD
jgi:hypothetical protein